MAPKWLFASFRQLYFSIFAVTITLLLSCDKKEGCLDPNATNYTIDAELNCCCTYPMLVAEIAFKTGEENVTLGDTFINDQGLDISILDFALYASDFNLTGSAGDVAQVSDLLEIGTQEVVDDIILIKRNEFSFPIGTFNEMRVFEQVQFKIGLIAPIKTLDLSAITLSSDHPLSIQEDSLYHDPPKGYDFIKLQVRIAQDEYTFIYSEEIPIALDLIITPVLGQDVTIPLKIQFDKWFSGIEESMDAQDIESKIFQNIQPSIVIQ